MTDLRFRQFPSPGVHAFSRPSPPRLGPDRAGPRHLAVGLADTDVVPIHALAFSPVGEFDGGGVAVGEIEAADADGFAGVGTGPEHFVGLGEIAQGPD